MKKLGLFLLISVFAFGSVFAQDNSVRPGKNNRPNRNNAPERNNRQRDVKSVTIEGTLKLEKGLIAVASGDSVYFVPMLTRYIGFIDGLKEGTNVSVEGIEARNFIHPSKVTINGKDYDFAGGGRVPGFRSDSFRPGQRRGDFGPGRGMQGPNWGKTPRRGNFFGWGGRRCWM